MNQGTEQDDQGKKPQDQREQQDNIPFWRVMLSVIQASFGVQSAKNKERDFSQGKLLPFIAAALIFTVCFVLLVMLAVRLALN